MFFGFFLWWISVVELLLLLQYESLNLQKRTQVLIITCVLSFHALRRFCIFFSKLFGSFGFDLICWGLFGQNQPT